MRPVNPAFEHFEFPLPRISEIKDVLVQASVYSELDLHQAFEQLRISKDLQDLCTFTTTFGKVSYLVLPFGAEFAAEAFQFSLHNLFSEVLNTCMILYIDNIIVYTNSVEAHLSALRRIFQLCRNANIRLNKEKCTILVSTLHTLGFVVTNGQIQPDLKKIQTLIDCPTPSNVTQLRGYLSLLQQFRDVLPHLSHVCHRLFKATSSALKFEWNTDLEKDFQNSKQMLCRELIRHEFDFEKKTVLYTDASNFAVSVVLTQENKLIICSSKSLSKSQIKWATIEKELYAIEYACKKLRQYLFGTKFVIRTDHNPLVSLFKHIERIENQRLLKMVLSTTEFSFELEYLPGSKNVVADFGSRNIPMTDYDRSEEIVTNFLSDALVPLPPINEDDLDTDDYDEINQFHLDTKKENNQIMVLVHGNWLVYVPKSLRRAVFWHLHFPRHFGITKMVSVVKEHNLYWPRLQLSLSHFLSQCQCALSKSNDSPPYQVTKHRFATKSMEIICIDIYKYHEEIFFTAIDLFSKFPFCFELKDETQPSILDAYQEFTSLYGSPQFILHDNQFNFLPGNHISSPANHPQANATLERFHKELGNMCRVHQCRPTSAIKYLRTQKAKMLFYSELKVQALEVMDTQVVALVASPTVFKKIDLCYRKVQARARAKHEDWYTGPHMILDRISDYTFIINSHSSKSQLIKVNVRDLKSFVIPDTSQWILNPIYLSSAMQELKLQKKEKPEQIFLDFKNLDKFTLQLISSTRKACFIVPDWPCCAWYKPLHRLIKAEAVKLPQAADLFLDSKGNQLGICSWKNWIFFTSDFF
jgi:RNase H-like domain found in reverse transcriptase/Reverse transcriptase (RNA-dependent DNA polymerase)